MNRELSEFLLWASFVAVGWTLGNIVRELLAEPIYRVWCWFFETFFNWR